MGSEPPRVSDGTDPLACPDGKGRLGVIRRGTPLPLNPLPVDAPRLIGSGRVFVPFLANQSGNFGVVLGRGGIYLVGVEDEEDLFDGLNDKARGGRDDPEPMEDPP